MVCKTFVGLDEVQCAKHCKEYLLVDKKVCYTRPGHTSFLSKVNLLTILKEHLVSVDIIRTARA